MISRKLRRRIRNWVVGLVGARALVFWNLTIRVRYEGYVRTGRVPMPPQSSIHVLWHQHLLLGTVCFRNTGFRCVISQHSDGEMIARVIDRLGMQAVRGSTTRGGAKVIQKIFGEVGGAKAFHVVITPDGPRGPIHSFQSGAIYLASRTGLPLCVNAVIAKSYWSMPSWDRFQIPKPFTRALIRAGEPVLIPPDLDRDGIEEYRQVFEKKLRQINEETAASFDELYVRAEPLMSLPDRG